MSDISRRDGILTNIRDVLAAINGAAGGFNLTAGALVQRDPFNIANGGVKDGTFNACIEPTTQGTLDYKERPNRVEHTFDVLITMRSDASGQAVDRKSVLAEKMIADLEVALARDITRGNRAIDTKLAEATPIFSIGTDNIVVVLQPVVVKIRRYYGQP